MTWFRIELRIADECPQDAERLISAQSDHTDTAASERCSECDDRIHVLHFTTGKTKSTETSCSLCALEIRLLLIISAELADVAHDPRRSTP